MYVSVGSPIICCLKSETIRQQSEEECAGARRDGEVWRRKMLHDRGRRTPVLAMAKDGLQPLGPKQPIFPLHLGMRHHPRSMLPTPIAVLSSTPWRRDGRVSREQQSAAARRPQAPRRSGTCSIEETSHFQSKCPVLLLQSTVPRKLDFYLQNQFIVPRIISSVHLLILKM